MRHSLCLSVGILLFAGICLAQQVAVQIPNGTEHWKKGDAQQIKWSCTPCTGTAEIHLVRVPTARVPTTMNRVGYEEIGVIKASIPITPATQFYSYSWKVGDYYGGSAPLGGGYKVLVTIVTGSGTVTDISDTAFVIGATPTIDYLAINDGLAVTNQRRVTLNYRFTGFPVPGSYRVRCTPRPGTLGMWTPMPSGSYPTYELPQEPGDYTIELWLANDLGFGPSKTDTIRYEVGPPPATTKDYTVNAATLTCGKFPDMNPAWYSCRCTAYTPTAPSSKNCYCTSAGSVIIKTDWMGIGAKVEYEFFGGGQLNPGWSFVSINYSSADCQADRGGGSAILTMPQAGSQNILFKIRLWTVGRLWIGRCEFRINSLVIRGPADRPVSEAFR
jgi:hypothetical protein